MPLPSSQTIGVFSGSSKLVFDALELDGPPTEAEIELETPWGTVSAPPQRVVMGERTLYVLHRHGAEHSIAPHEINYRANLWLMRELNVEAVVGTHTVGGIHPDLAVGDLVLPEQLIDYTWGRPSTFDDELRHIEFSDPYDATLRRSLMDAHAAMNEGPRLIAEGVYGVTQGPRLETAAEIRRMARDGSTVVGMTGMPEAGLAGELGLAYCSLCLVVNPAAGLTDAPIDLDDLRRASQAGASAIARLLGAAFLRL